MYHVMQKLVACTQPRSNYRFKHNCALPLRCAPSSSALLTSRALWKTPHTRESHTRALAPSVVSPSFTQVSVDCTAVTIRHQILIKVDLAVYNVLSESPVEWVCAYTYVHENLASYTCTWVRVSVVVVRINWKRWLGWKFNKLWTSNNVYMLVKRECVARFYYLWR